ncbi:MAG: magnesium chelatase ATPase subunit D, partial [Roseobacter sp.]
MSDSWVRAATCLRLLNAAPGYLGGAVVRMRSGPERDLIMDGLRGLRARKLHPAVSDEHLFGGLDLSATLQSGQYVKTSGVYATPCTVILTMAERCAPDLAAKIAHQIDRDAGHCLIALDEGAEPQEAAPLALADRVPFHIAPESRPPAGWTPDPPSQNACDPRRVSASPDDAATLAVLAAQFGIDSLRAPLLALRVARTHAAIAGRSAVTQADLQQAAGLVYPQRATQVPQDAEDTPPAEPDAAQAQANDGAQDPLDIPQGDMLVVAVRAL